MRFYGTFHYQGKMEHINQFVASAERLLQDNSNPYSHTMIVFGINNFSDIITNYGFAAGEELAGYVKSVLKSYLQEPNLFCHYQAGSFAMFLEDYKDIDLALLVIQITEEITRYHKDYNLKLSFGVCKASPSASTFYCLYRRAMYAKSSVNTDAFQLLADYSEVVRL
jgi:GGDEF domain-containing protein